MNQLLLGYIPKKWTDDDNADRPGWISTGADDGTISNFIEYENIYDDDDIPEAISIDPEGDDIRLVLTDENFKETFNKLAGKYFSDIHDQNNDLDVPSALQVGWYILEDDCPDEEVLENFGLSQIICINDELDANEFSNAGGKYNGCMYLQLRSEDQIDNDEDGSVYILKPLKY